MNTTNLVCDAVYNILRVAIYRTLVGPTLFTNLTYIAEAFIYWVNPSCGVFGQS